MYNDDQIEVYIHHNVNNDLIFSVFYARIKNRFFMFLLLGVNIHKFVIMVLNMESIMKSKIRKLMKKGRFGMKMRNRLYKLI
jgi:hypothetical protein